MLISWRVSVVVFSRVFSPFAKSSPSVAPGAHRCFGASVFSNAWGDLGGKTRDPYHPCMVYDLYIYHKNQPFM